MVRVQETVVDPQLNELSEKIQDLSLELHRGGGGVLLERFDDKRFKETDVVVDDVLREKEKGGNPVGRQEGRNA